MNSNDATDFRDGSQNEKISGIMGVIACPMLEDELIYSILCDTDDKVVYVVNTGYQGSLVKKLSNQAIPYTLVEEYTLNRAREDLDRSRYNIVIYMNRLGLHEHPKNLKNTIEEETAFYLDIFDTIMVFYGLCGNYGWDISKFASERSSIPVITLRDEKDRICDDCIGVAVGGTDKYLSLNKAYTGVLYLTPAMATNWEDFNRASEMMRGCDVSDHSMMRMIFEMCGYKYALKLDTGLGDREEYEKCAQEICREMNLELLTPEDNWTTLEPVKNAYNKAKQALKDMNCS